MPVATCLSFKAFTLITIAVATSAVAIRHGFANKPPSGRWSLSFSVSLGVYPLPIMPCSFALSICSTASRDRPMIRHARSMSLIAS